jgi:hypothetical protein
MVLMSMLWRLARSIGDHILELALGPCSCCVLDAEGAQAGGVSCIATSRNLAPKRN